MAKYDAITAAAINHLVRATLCPTKASGAELLQAIEAKHPGAIDRARARVKAERFDSKFKGTVPKWVKTLVAKYSRGNVGEVRIRQSRSKTYTSGHCWYGSGDVVVTLSKTGSDENEQRAVLLHEIAHAIALWDRHGDRFHDEWYEMLRSENLYRYTITCGRFRTQSLKAAARRARAKRPLTSVA